MADNKAEILLTAINRTGPAFAQVQRGLDGMVSSARGASAMLGKVGTLMAGLGVGALAGGSLIAGIKGIADGLDALNDAADATGSSVENISALEDIAKRTGGTLDTVEATLVKFNQTLANADEKSPITAALKSIGLSAAELRQQDPAQALLKTAQALQGYANDGNKARLVQELFGKSVREVAPLLKDLAEAGELNGKVTKQQAEEAERFNQNLARMQKNIEDAARTVVGGMLPALSQFIEKLAAAEKAFGSFMQARWFESNTPLENLRNVQAEIGRTGEKIAQTQADLAKFGEGVARGGRGRGVGGRVEPGRSKELEALQERMTELRKFEDYYTRILKLEDKAGAGRGAMARGVGESEYEPRKPRAADVSGLGGGSAKSGQSEADRYLQQLQQQLDSTRELGVLQTTLNRIQRGEIDGLTAANKPRILQTAAEVDLQKDLVELARDADKAQEEALRQQQQGIQEADQLWRSLLTPTEQYVLQLERIKELAASGAFGDPNSAEAAAKVGQVQDRLKQQLDEQLEKANKVNDAAKDLQMTFTSAFEDAIVGGKGLSSVLKGLEQDLMRIVLRKSITEPLGNALGSMVSSWFSFGGARAAGGPVDAGKSYLVGESGPEIFSPARSGTIVPNHAIGGGAINVTQNISVQSGVNRGELEAAMRIAKDTAKAEILDSQRRRGVFAR